MMYFLIAYIIAALVVVYIVLRDDRRERKGWEIINQMEARWPSDRKPK